MRSSGTNLVLAVTRPLSVRETFNGHDAGRSANTVDCGLVSVSVAYRLAEQLLNWLTEHNATLAALSQTQLDRWRAEGPSTRAIANSFLGWAMKAQLTTTTLILPVAQKPPHRGCQRSSRTASSPRSELVRNSPPEPAPPRS